MCYIGICESETKQRVADKDISVFKVVKGTDEKNIFLSDIMSFTYQIGGIYETKMIMDSSAIGVEVNEGFHCFCSGLIGIEYDISNGNAPRYYIVTGKGFKMYMCPLYRVNEYMPKFELYRMDCIIPKGSSYYINKLGEMVSDKIQVLSVTKLEAPGT